MQFLKMFGITVLVVLAFFRFDMADLKAADKYTINLANSTVGFSIMRMGLNNLTGRFKEFSGSILFDEQNVSNSKVEVTIKTASFDSGFDARDKDLRSPNFFNVFEFPEMKFVSTKIVKTGENTGTITGNLTLLGVTKPVTLKTKFNRTSIHPRNKKTYSGFSATGTLDRTDWGMNRLAKFVGPQVNLIIEVLAEKL